VRVLGVVLILGTLGPVLRAGEETVETPPALALSSLLPDAARKGPHHEVLEPVTSQGFLAQFRMTSPYGEYAVTSRRLLEIRAHEVETLAGVTQRRGAPEALKAIGASLAQLPTAAVELVLHPIHSAKRLGKGLGKTFGRLKDAFGGRRRSPYEDPSLETALSGDQKRELADSLNLDVYSTNPQVQAFLDRVGRARAAGTLTVDVASLALPVVGFMAVTVTGWQADVRRLLRDHTPAELERENAAVLARLGIPTDVARAFLLDDALSPRHETVITHAAEQLGGVAGLEALFEAARTATNEVGALYQEQQAVLLTTHRDGRFDRLEAVFHVVLARCEDGRVVAYLPYDSVYASAEWPRLLDALAGAALARSATSRTLYVTGKVSSKARAAARDRGFEIHAEFTPEAEPSAD
jgi:hypothetical protein